MPGTAWSAPARHPDARDQISQSLGRWPQIHDVHNEPDDATTRKCIGRLMSGPECRSVPSTPGAVSGRTGARPGHVVPVSRRPRPPAAAAPVPARAAQPRRRRRSLTSKCICCGQPGSGHRGGWKSGASWNPMPDAASSSRDDHEIVLLPGDREAEELGVEPGERCRVGTVDDHMVKASDHGVHPAHRRAQASAGSGPGGRPAQR